MADTRNMTLRRERLILRAARICGMLLAGVLITWLVVASLGIPIPLSGYRDSVETAATQLLGRDVRIQGSLNLRPGIVPALIAHDVRISGPAERDEPIRAGQVTVFLAPVAILRGESIIRRLLIEDVAISLDTRSTGSGAAHPLLAEGAGLLVQHSRLQEVILRRLKVTVRDNNKEESYPVEFDELGIHTKPGQALELKLLGRFQQQPFTVDITGSPLADLLAPSGRWPLRAELVFADKPVLLNGVLETSRQGYAMDFELQADWPAEFERYAKRLGPGPLTGRLELQGGGDQRLTGGELRLPAIDAIVRVGAAAAGPSADMRKQAGRSGKVRPDNALSLPLMVELAGEAFHGQLILAGKSKDAGIEVTLAASDADAGRLMQALTGTTGIRARARHIGFEASARFGGKADLVDRVALAVEMDDTRYSYGNANGERSIDVDLDKLALTLPAGKELVMHAAGTLLEKPFNVELTLGELETLLTAEYWPVKLSATGSGATLDVSGPLAVVNEDARTRMHVSLYGQHLGDLAAWLGVSPCAVTPFTLRGELVLAENLGQLQFLRIQTETTRFSGDLDWSGDDRIALLHAVLQFETLDPADIEVLVPLVRLSSDGAAVRGMAIDMPVLPGPVEILNADIDMEIASVVHELVDITEVTLAAEIRDGSLQRSPFHAHIGNLSFQGYLDPANTETGVVFINDADDSDAAGLMERLFSSVLQWAGSNAVVPLRWIFKKKFSDGKPVDCNA